MHQHFTSIWVLTTFYFLAFSVALDLFYHYIAQMHLFYPGLLVAHVKRLIISLIELWSGWFLWLKNGVNICHLDYKRNHNRDPVVYKIKDWFHAKCKKLKHENGSKSGHFTWTKWLKTSSTCKSTVITPSARNISIVLYWTSCTLDNYRSTTHF